MTSSLNLNNNKIVNLGTPTADQDAATKVYVDTAGGLALLKASNLSDVANATTSRTNLSAAKSGANSDITSITGLTTPLTVAQGGIGAATLTANNVILGNGTSAVQVVAPSTNGNILTSNGTTWTSAAPAGVTSAVAGNGMAVSGATGAVTFSLACPTWGTVGSDACGIGTSTGNQGSSGSVVNPTLLTVGTNYSAANAGISGGSGTWKCMGRSGADFVYYSYDQSCVRYEGLFINNYIYVFCRVS
jgi:hypothetical protein